MLLRSSVYALLLSILAGCSSVTHTLGDRRWFNAALPIHLQSTLYEQEASFCAQAADQWVPLPKVAYSYSGVRLINGSPNVSVGGGSLGDQKQPCHGVGKLRCLRMECNWCSSCARSS